MMRMSNKSFFFCDFFFQIGIPLSPNILFSFRLVQYMFVGNNFIIPEVDPVGRDGPTLEGLLTVSEHLNGPQDHPHEIRYM